jgi:ACS family hexuronate transporter-like MFS transporter
MERFYSSEFHWTNNDYGNITALFSFFMLCHYCFAGRFVDWLDTKRFSLGNWNMVYWSLLTCFFIATSGIITGNWFVGFDGAKKSLVPSMMEWSLM